MAEVSEKSSNSGKKENIYKMRIARSIGIRYPKMKIMKWTLYPTANDNVDIGMSPRRKIFTFNLLYIRLSNEVEKFRKTFIVFEDELAKRNV